MALTTKAEIKSEILANIDQYKLAAYPEDLLTEYADGLVPIYNNEIIAEWTEMPSEFDDSWSQYGMDEAFLKGGIIKLMSVDLFEYYHSLYSEAWAEIVEELGL